MSVSRRLRFFSVCVCVFVCLCVCVCVCLCVCQGTPLHQVSPFSFVFPSSSLNWRVELCVCLCVSVCAPPVSMEAHSNLVHKISHRLFCAMRHWFQMTSLPSRSPGGPRAPLEGPPGAHWLKMTSRGLVGGGGAELRGSGGGEGRGQWCVCARGRSEAFHVVARESAEGAAALAGADVPPVVALLQDAHRVALVQFQFVVVLRRVRVHGPVPARHGETNQTHSTTRRVWCVVSDDLQNGLWTRVDHEVRVRRRARRLGRPVSLQQLRRRIVAAHPRLERHKKQKDIGQHRRPGGS